MEKTPQEMAAEIKSTIASLTNKLEAVEAKETATPEEVKAANDALEAFKNENAESLKGFVKADDFAALKTSLEDAETEIASLKANATASANAQDLSFDSMIASAIKENHDALVQFTQNKSKGGSFEIEIKVPDTITTTNIGNAGTPDNYAALLENSYDPFLRDEIYVEDFFDVGSTDLATIGYVVELPGEGDAEIVAEGSLKPYIDVDFETKFSQAVKVAGVMKASEESLHDFKFLQTAMSKTLRRKHDIARQNHLLGPNGITGAASTFNPTLISGMGLTVQNPQKYDVVCAMQTAIAVQSEGNFMANVIFVNNIDYLDMKLEKDDDNNYLTPPFVMADGKEVGGVRVVARPTIPVGTFIIGDFKNVKLRNVWNYRVRFGYENDDIRRNLITMIGESRFHVYVSDNEQRGIISGTFDDVITAFNA